MNRLWKSACVVLAIFSLIIAANPALAQGVKTAGRVAENRYNLPTPVNNYVNDYAKILTPLSSDRLKQILGQVEKDTGIEISLVTVLSMSDFHVGADVELLAREFLNTWGVGNQPRNDGIIILVARTERKMAIEVGDGWSLMLKSSLKKIIDTDFIPRFKSEQYDQGIVEGVEAVVKLVTRPRVWYEQKWVQSMALVLLILFLVGIAISCFRSGSNGWGWVFLVLAGTAVVTLIQLLLSSSSRGSSSSFGGGFSSGGGGASGSW